MDCQICTEKIVRPSRRAVTCFCGETACSICVKEFLLNSIDDPKCMFCRALWTRQFANQALGPTFVNGPLKRHREKILHDRQKAFEPQIREEVARQQIRKKTRERIQEISRLITELSNERYRLMSGSPHGEHSERVAKFRSVCPSEDCQGMIDRNRCLVCDLEVCRDCREVKHEGDCSPEILQTLELLRKDTKPCPKCHVLINKYSGCDQSFCTQCKTLFSWRTLEIVTRGPLHNPHYLDWISSEGGARPVDRHPANARCFDFDNRYDMRDFRILMRVPRPAIDIPADMSVRQPTTVDSNLVISAAATFTSHLIGDEIEGHEPLAYDSPKFIKLGVEYMESKITGSAYQMRLQRLEKRLRKRAEVVAVLNTFVETVRDSITSRLELPATSVDVTDSKCLELAEYLIDLTQMTNKALASIGVSYSNSAHKIKFGDFRFGLF
jgi:hypothetical protein